MQIEISLPDTSGAENNTERGMLHWLKQLELAVHHAQKSVKEMATMIRERDSSEEPAITGYLRVENIVEDEPGSGGTGDITIRIYEA